MSKIKYDVAHVASVFEVNPKEDRVLITSDGNVFLTAAEGYCKNHCASMKCEYDTLLRADFEKGGKKEEKDWKDGKFGEIVKFAKSKGLEATTKSNEGTKKLIEEVEEFLKTLPTEDTQEEKTEDQ